MNKTILILWGLFFLPSHGFALDPNLQMKKTPSRPSLSAEVITEDFTVIDNCDDDKVCFEGILYNKGLQPAYQTRLRIEIGGMKNTRPRTFFYQKIETPTLNPGDRQLFTLNVLRKISYKDKNHIEKFIDVGKYNVKAVPEWKDTPAPPSVVKKRKKS
ncbi:MAG: hypothetical protein ACKVQC_01270 [Elusimicrobiota bacterium]